MDCCVQCPGPNPVAKCLRAVNISPHPNAKLLERPDWPSQNSKFAAKHMHTYSNPYTSPPLLRRTSSCRIHITKCSPTFTFKHSHRANRNACTPTAGEWHPQIASSPMTAVQQESLLIRPCRDHSASSPASWRMDGSLTSQHMTTIQTAAFRCAMGRGLPRLSRIGQSWASRRPNLVFLLFLINQSALRPENTPNRLSPSSCREARIG